MIDDDDSPPWHVEMKNPTKIVVPPPMPEKGELIIVNKKTHKPTPNDFYCGRGSPVGNPFDFRGSTHAQAKYKVANREEAISCYETYLREKIKNKDPEICAALNKIYKMLKNGPVYLICYCYPEHDCHVRIIKEIIEEKIKSAAK